MALEQQGNKQWKTDTLEGLAKGSKVWFRTQDDDYRFGTILALDDPQHVRVQLEADPEHGQRAETLEAVPAEALKPANPAILEGVQDLTHLSYLNEPSLLHNLRARHTSDDIYTTAGPVLIAVNPYKRLPLYGPDMVAKYKGAGGKCKDPHPFAVADATYAAMQSDMQSQSVVISGESGAGKTETTKIVMQYLAGLAGGTGIEDRVLQTNPILEGFGNAKTLRNNNSSRFGKLIQIYFNGRHIAGALIKTYLLEKSRVVLQGQGERSYHVFYQLVAGATPQERAELRLPDNPEDFRYLGQSGCTAIDGVDDSEEFHDMKKAMSMVGITEEEQASIFRLVASVMWLGNVTFEEQPDETVRVVEDGALGNVVELLKCDRATLCKALTGRQIQAGRETIWQQLRLSQACDARDALAKALYSALFDWLVQRINASLGDTKRMQKALSINILDIYGFEHFETNSFEQLCINFANERLQQQFNKYLFKLEQEEYSREGIDWAHVDFEDNQACVDLIEQKMPKGVGVISLLDEECVFPKATDETYGEKLAAQLSGHPNFSSRSHIRNQFTVHHYAGPVTYTTDGFLDKNKDAISLDLLGALQSSSVALLQGLARAMAERQTAKNSLTVGSFFREQLRTLVDTLESTQLHFVRCIKPNPEQAPLLLDNGLVLSQLRCCGVLEVVRIARAGYPTRYLHEQFADRYHILMPESAGGKGCGYDCPALEMCQRILKQFQIDPAMYQVGRSKLFFRAGLLGRMEDTWERMIRSACTIQAFMRMAVVRAAFLRLRAAAVACQAARRGALQRRTYAELLRQHRASLVLASYWRARLVRLGYLRTLRAVVAIQMAWRRRVMAQRMAVARGERLQREATAAKAEAARRAEAARWDNVRDEFGGDWEAIRATMAWAARIKARHGAEAEIEQALEAYENGEVVAKGQAAAAAAAAPAASGEEVEALREEAAQLRSDREALLDDLTAEKGRREECEEKLEMAEEQWIAQMAALQQVLANVKHELGGGKDAAAAVEVFAGDLERFRDRLPAHHTEAGALSRDKIKANGGRPRNVVGAQANKEAMQVVGRLKDDLDMRTQVYDDDVDFIREVKEGLTDAPDMDPNYELKNLSHRFEAWKRDFKQRLHEAKHMIKKLDRANNHQSAYSFASPENSMDVSEMNDNHRRHQQGRPGGVTPPARRSSSGVSAEPHYPPEPAYAPATKPMGSHQKSGTTGYDSESSVGNSVIGTQAYYGEAEMSTPAYRVGPAATPPPPHHLSNPHQDTQESTADAMKKKKHNGFGKMFSIGKRVVSGR